MMPYWVYILQSETTGRFYVGQTADLAERLRRHRDGRTTATKGRGPWRLIYQETVASRQAAVAPT